MLSLIKDHHRLLRTMYLHSESCILLCTVVMMVRLMNVIMDGDEVVCEEI
jgi:hypothetical protein